MWNAHPPCSSFFRFFPRAPGAAKNYHSLPRQRTSSTKRLTVFIFLCRRGGRHKGHPLRQKWSPKRNAAGSDHPVHLEFWRQQTSFHKFTRSSRVPARQSRRLPMALQSGRLQAQETPSDDAHMSLMMAENTNACAAPVQKRLDLSLPSPNFLSFCEHGTPQMKDMLPMVLEEHAS